VKLSAIRALLKRAGIKTTTPIDRISVKYEHGTAMGIDVMLTTGGVEYIPVEASTTDPPLPDTRRPGWVPEPQ